MQAILDELEFYSNVQQIAKAGQKEVFTGERDGIKYALKQGNEPGPHGQSRITREINILRGINSIYYPRIYNFIQSSLADRYLIVEEYIQHLERTQILNYFDTEEKLLLLLKQLVEGLLLLWDNGIVHRDIKPDNILIRPDYSPVIIDLGIAKDMNATNLTNTGWHTPHTRCYAAPEQLMNLGPEIDLRTDIFLLGIFILELHLGFHPFNREFPLNPDITPENIVYNNYIRPSAKQGSSEAFCDIINRMLRPKRYDRFKNAEQLLKAIEGALK